MNKCIPGKCLKTFGVAGQLDKLEEELKELLAVILFHEGTPEQLLADPDFIKEGGDVWNVLLSINIASMGMVEEAADHKRLRTDIRLRNGYYE